MDAPPLPRFRVRVDGRAPMIVHAATATEAAETAAGAWFDDWRSAGGVSVVVTTAKGVESQ